MSDKKIRFNSTIDEIINSLNAAIGRKKVNQIQNYKEEPNEDVIELESEVEEIDDLARNFDTNRSELKDFYAQKYKSKSSEDFKSNFENWLDDSDSKIENRFFAEKFGEEFYNLTLDKLVYKITKEVVKEWVDANLKYIASDILSEEIEKKLKKK